MPTLATPRKLISTDDVKIGFWNSVSISNGTKDYPKRRTTQKLGQTSWFEKNRVIKRYFLAILITTMFPYLNLTLTRSNQLSKRVALPPIAIL